MKFTVSSTHLLKQLQVLSGVINTNNTFPILDNFLFDIDEKELKITASDSETTLSATIDIDSEDKGSVVIPQKLLLETLKTFPEQPLTFKILENKRLEIVSEQGTYDMAYSEGDEYPKTHQEGLDKNSVTLPAELLFKAMGTTLFAVADDDLRPAMTGVLFEFDPKEGIVFVATDAHKLVQYSRKDVKVDKEVHFIVPRKPLGLLKSFLSNDDQKVDINYNETNVRFVFENTVMTARLIDAKYPNYKQLISTENPNKLCVDRTAFLNVAKRAEIYANKTTHLICLEMAGTKLEVSAQDMDYAHSSKETLICNYQGEYMKIGFNAKFISEMLRNIASQEVAIDMSSPNSAGILSPMDSCLEGEKIIMLLMPLSV